MALEKPKHGMPFAAPPTAEMLEDTDDGQMFPTLNAMIDTIPKVDFGPAPTFEAPDFDKHLGAIQGHLDGLSDHFNKHVLGAGEHVLVEVVRQAVEVALDRAEVLVEILSLIHI